MHDSYPISPFKGRNIVDLSFVCQQLGHRDLPFEKQCYRHLLTVKLNTDIKHIWLINCPNVRSLHNLFFEIRHHKDARLEKGERRQNSLIGTLRFHSVGQDQGAHS